jgi:hypothetical protein
VEEIVAERFRVVPLTIFHSVELVIDVIASICDLRSSAESACLELVCVIALQSGYEGASARIGTVDFVAFKEVV